MRIQNRNILPGRKQNVSASLHRNKGYPWATIMAYSISLVGHVTKLF